MTQLTLRHFDAKKAEQLIFFFLKKAEASQKNITKLRLIKWLYLAERGSYQEFGSPLTGDRLGALRHGPAPSETLALIEGKSRNFATNLLSQTITVEKNPRHQYVHISKTCRYNSLDDLDRFSEAEMELLESIWQEYGEWSARDLETHLHNTNIYPEWTWKRGDGTNWIELENLLQYVGFPSEEVESITNGIVAFYPSENT